MRVRNRYRKFIGSDFSFRETAQQLAAQISGENAIIERDENGGAFLVVADRQRLGVNVLENPVRFSVAGEIAVQANRIVGCDINFGHANDVSEISGS